MSLEQTLPSHLAKLTDRELARLLVESAKIAFADPDQEDDPDSEYYDPTTQTYLDVMDLIQQEIEKRKAAKQHLD